MKKEESSLAGYVSEPSFRTEVADVRLNLNHFKLELHCNNNIK